ncbi:MAG: hypothetical protein KF819_08345 [Labilithrix sp.]|nr:hypothetical protein [Labilithrix sp.]
MKSSLIAGLFTSFAGVIVACGATVQSEPQPDPPVADAGPAPDANADAPTKPSSCSAPLVDPKCATQTPAPTTPAAVETFVKDNAIPLRCDGGGNEAVWDLRPLVDLYGDQKIFMIGEVHGSNEIGIVSSLVFEELAAKKLVNVVAFELPMDLEPALQRYVDTGKDPMAEQMIRSMATNMFGAILPKSARALAAKGVALRVGAVDIPYDPATPVAAIQEVAAKLTTQKDVVLATLPTNATPGNPADVQAANAYFDHITSKKTEICAELSEADCDRLVAMTHALWCVVLSDDRGGSEQWFARREQVIYYNMHAKMTAETDRMFLHMGAAHTNKLSFSAGSRMAKEWPLTKGRVFSVAPAYGDGSVIWYGGDMDLPGEPESIVSALGADAQPFFMSTTRPSATCQANPIQDEPEQTVGVGGTRGEVYDGYIHYGKLTSERRPGDTKLSRAGASPSDGARAASSLDATSARILAFRATIERREREALTARGVGARR